MSVLNAENRPGRYKQRKNCISELKKPNKNPPVSTYKFYQRSAAKNTFSAQAAVFSHKLQLARERISQMPGVPLR